MQDKLRKALTKWGPVMPDELREALESALAAPPAVAKVLFDNRLGWGEGRNPYAPRELWADLGASLYGEDDPRVKELRTDVASGSAPIAAAPPEPHIASSDRAAAWHRKANATIRDDKDPGTIVGAVFGELERAVRKFPTWPTDPLHALAVLGEEFGELTKDVLQLSYEPHKTSAANVRAEAIQTAAMALRFAASLDVYIYAQAEQHRQEQWEADRKRYYESGGLHPCYD